MTTGGHAAHAATLRDYLQVARRRKWIILQAVVLVPLAAVLYSLNQQKLYQANAQVLLSSQNLATQLTGTQSVGINLQPDRIAQTQATIARVPQLAQRVLARVPGTGLTPQQLLAASSVSTAANADILTFSVTDHDPALARRLVNAYAAAYTVYRRQLDTASIARALSSANAKLKALVRAGDRKTALYATLVDRQQTLATMEALQTSNASVVQRAEQAAQVRPKPSRNATLGLVLGIALGVGLAFLWEALDTRVRSAEEIGEKLGGLALLARVPSPSKKARAEHRLVMLDEPTGTQAETFRMLRTNLDFVSLDRDARTIMVTSAVEQEGKSTTIANLAIAMARAGQRVVLVDLDLRRPYIDRFFDIQGPGVTQVALGHVPLEQALATVAIADPNLAEVSSTRPAASGRVKVSGGNGNGNGNGNGHAKVVKGVLQVLPAGPIPPDPGEFVNTQALSEILAELRSRFDVVLIDAPPALRVGDALTLSKKVDGVIVVARMKVVRRQMLAELARQLGAMPTPVLGFVVTAAGDEPDYGYGYGYHAKPYVQDEQVERERSKA
jgi:Mrp family chromosome partitioning ATPase/capsular polysaccharide biosynthesis protein